ncbi:MAG TPA: SDR family oxidoreductase [Solirubrobacterales bacterium]|nr:SDR family oxidoreductase [Solirubrobacterales bacterium]
MRVFVTGASGHIGTPTVSELLSAGHEVVGLARSDASAAKLEALGAEVRRGDLDDLDGLQEAAAEADGVIHLAFRHDLMQSGNMEGAIAADMAATQAFGDALAGTGKPFVNTSGTLMLAMMGIEGRAGTEEDRSPGGHRADVENATLAFADRGVRSSVIRLSPLVHSDLDKHGFGPILIGIAREQGFAGYPAEGTNRWPAVHTLDAADLYRRAVESAPAGQILHGVGDEGVPTREIAAAIGRGTGLEVRSIPTDEIPGYFGPLAGFIALDDPTSNTITRELLGWEPTHASLIADLDDGHYFT